MNLLGNFYQRKCTSVDLFTFQLQLWFENPTQQLSFKNALPQIEAPYNSKYEASKEIQATFLKGLLEGLKKYGLMRQVVS